MKLEKCEAHNEPLQVQIVQDQGVKGTGNVGPDSLTITLSVKSYAVWKNVLSAFQCILKKKSEQYKHTLTSLLGHMLSTAYEAGILTVFTEVKKYLGQLHMFLYQVFTVKFIILEFGICNYHLNPDLLSGLPLQRQTDGDFSLLLSI